MATPSQPINTPQPHQQQGYAPSPYAQAPPYGSPYATSPYNNNGYFPGSQQHTPQHASRPHSRSSPPSPYNLPPSAAPQQQQQPQYGGQYSSSPQANNNNNNNGYLAATASPRLMPVPQGQPMLSPNAAAAGGPYSSSPNSRSYPPPTSYPMGNPALDGPYAQQQRPRITSNASHHSHRSHHSHHSRGDEYDYDTDSDRGDSLRPPGRSRHASFDGYGYGYGYAHQHQHHGHHRRSSYDGRERRKSDAERIRESNSRPTLGDSMYLAWDTLKGALTGRRE